MRLFTTLMAIILTVMCSVECFADEQKQVSLTIYNQNLALVRDVRTMKIPEGTGTLRFADIASQIDATSVHFSVLPLSSSCTILEQNFEYDLVSSEKLLLKYLDKQIKVRTKDDFQYEGALASYDGNQLVLVMDREKGPVVMVNRENVKNVEFPQLPGGLITRPSLVWLVRSAKGGDQTAEVSYLTGGMNWRADYVVTVGKDEKTISLNGWVTIVNTSGASYEDAGIKLIAGDVNRVAEAGGRPQSLMKTAMAMDAVAAPQFEEKAFFEYHLYTLQRAATLKNNQTKQISLLFAPSIAAEKVYHYDGAVQRWYHYDNWRQPANTKVAVKMEFKNSEKNGLGIPLPQGKIRVYKADSDGTLQFIGEDSIDHTPKDERLDLLLGNAFDIVGERKITDHKILGTNLFRDSYEITIRNHKSEAVTVKAVERQWGDWKIVQNSMSFEKKDAGTVEFSIPVAKDGEARVTYVAEYKL